jgi:hypothetical protein
MRCRVLKINLQMAHVSVFHVGDVAATILRWIY